MSEKRNCLLHGALDVEWYTDDIPDIDGKPRCWVCELEEKKEKAEALVKDMYEALKAITNETPNSHTCVSMQDIAKAALKKAENK